MLRCEISCAGKRSPFTTGNVEETMKNELNRRKRKSIFTDLTGHWWTFTFKILTQSRQCGIRITKMFIFPLLDKDVVFASIQE
jgi:ribosome-associated toxin RatA of RatAB toxin-antitoxin module